MSFWKNRLKQNILIKYIYENLIMYRKKNIFKSKGKKRALLSYSTFPFIKKYKTKIHPNIVENLYLAEILNDYGYIVDVYNNIFPGKINYKKYDVIIGEGLPISNYFFQKKIKKIRTIYYATGSHPFYNNAQSYKALFRFYEKHKKYIHKSSRIVNCKWGVGASLSEYLILLGNGQTEMTFTENGISLQKIFKLHAPYYASNVISDFSKKNKNKFLWFGSYGLIHKNLDVIIDVFTKFVDLELHVCGYINGESDFVDVYKNAIKESKNIYLHGFISVDSSKFKKFMEECSFVILSSCAEGCATAVVTAMGNGGLIPLISRQCGVDIINGVIFDNNDEATIEGGIKNIITYTEEKIIEYSKENIKYIQRYFSIEKYKVNIRNIFSNIFEGVK